MKTGLRMGEGKGGAIDYKTLRRFNAEAARRAVVEYMKTKSNISESPKLPGCSGLPVP